MNLLIKNKAGSRAFILPESNVAEVSYQSDVVTISDRGNVVATIWQSSKSSGYDKIPQAVTMAMELGDRSLIVDEDWGEIYDDLFKRWKNS